MQISPISTATRLEAAVQADGRLAVRELHQADSGESEVRSYLAEPAADLDAMLLSHGQQFLERLTKRISASEEPAVVEAQEMYPVGAVFISVLDANPFTQLGYGTWQAIGAGRMLVGFDAGDPDFDTLEETGGAKAVTLTVAQMPQHTHAQDAHNHTQDPHTHVQNAHNHVQNAASVATGGLVGSTPDSSTNTSVASGYSTANATAVNQNATATNQAATAVNQSTGGGQAHNNMPPYFVCRFWKRVA